MNVLGVSGDHIALVADTGRLLLRDRLNTGRTAGLVLLDVPAVRAQVGPLNAACAVLERPSGTETFEQGALYGSTISTLKALGISVRTEMPAWRDAMRVHGDVIGAAMERFSARDFADEAEAIAALLALHGSRFPSLQAQVAAPRRLDPLPRVFPVRAVLSDAVL